MRVGLWGARADQGGLAAMTYEFARHVRPERIVVVDISGGGARVKLRGRTRPELFRPFGEVAVQVGMNDYVDARDVRRFCDGLDVIYGAEWFYREDFCDIARECGVRTVLHAMPEMWRRKDSPPDVVWAPTDWELGHRDHTNQPQMPNAAVVPVPVPTDTFAPLPAGGKAVLHLGSPAFHDRNGSDLVRQALRWMDYDATVVWASDPDHPAPTNPMTVRGRKVDLRWQSTDAADRRDAYPDECGILLLPRRFGGLCLPFQEAAALGWVIVTTDLAPQNQWVHPAGLVASSAADLVRMVGGWYDVHTANPRHLAVAVGELLADDGRYMSARAASCAHAEEISWAAWRPRYEKLLAEAAEAPPHGAHRTSRGLAVWPRRP